MQLQIQFNDGLTSSVTRHVLCLQAPVSVEYRLRWFSESHMYLITVS
jgi:hypothetical protein